MQSDYKPLGAALNQLDALPGLDYMIQPQLSGSKEYGKLEKNVLSDEQMADIADLQYGVSLIGVSGLGYDICGACDGVWYTWNTAIDKHVSDTKNDYGGTLVWYPRFAEDGTVIRYNVDGETGTDEDHRYMSLLTYHFAEETEFSSFAFVVENQKKFPQAGDVYISQDGQSWTLLGSWDRNARREKGEDYRFSSAYLDYMARTAKCSMLGFSLNDAKGSYLRFAFTAAGGRDVSEPSAYSKYSSAAGNIMTFRELAVFGKEAIVRGEEETLYNGIVLPENWRAEGIDPADSGLMAPQVVPYLKSEEEGGSRPEVIDVTVGRQLFVDDFLTEETDLTLNYHSPEKYEGNPVLSAETTAEVLGSASAMMASGGVWYDMEEKLFKMWYDAGFAQRLAYAESRDGIHWERPALNEDGSNLILDEIEKADGTAVWIDYDAPASERYKLFVRIPGTEHPAYLYTSADGIEWERLEAKTSPVGDRSTFFYNPFRKKWVLSARYNLYGPLNRLRAYAETDDFTDGWQGEKQIFWLKPDTLDKWDPQWNLKPQLYNFDAVAYESIMLGTIQIWTGPENDVCSSLSMPKTTELFISYSRDGYHFDRPDRAPFIEAARQEGIWDRGYVESTCGGVIVFDDELWIYYSGFSGKYTADNGTTVSGMHYGGSVGIAKLRRDGFASLDGSGTVLTRTMTVDGGKKYLFVNVDAPEGMLKAEILDAEGNPVPGYTLEDCQGVSGDTTKAMVEWKGGSDVSFVNGTNFRIRFQMENGQFYAFWLSKDEEGSSDGMTAAGYVNAADYAAAQEEVPESTQAEETQAEESTAESEQQETTAAAESSVQTTAAAETPAEVSAETGGAGKAGALAGAGAAVLAACAGGAYLYKKKKTDQTEE